MILTDGVHLMSDSLDELHSFAGKIGLKRKWFQNHERHPHYDLTSNRIVQKALKNGANIVNSRELVMLIKKQRKAVE